MFHAEEMSELSLLVPRQDIEAVTKAIAQKGVLHQIDTSYLSRSEDGSAEPWLDRIQEYQGFEQRILLMTGTLQTSEALAEGSDLTATLGSAELRDRILAIEREVMPLVRQLKGLEQRLAELQVLQQRLRPLAALDVDLASLRDLSFLHAQVGIIPAANLDRFNSSLLHVPHVIMNLGEEGSGTLVALFGSARDREILDRAANSAYMAPISMPTEYRGTPAAIGRALGEEAEQLRAQKNALDLETARLRDAWGQPLAELLWHARSDLSLMRAAHHFGQVRDVYLVAGWVPTRRLPELVQAVRDLTSGRVEVDIATAEQAGDAASVPTTLGNRGLFKAFQGLVTNYAFPAYNEIDPTPLVAISFVVMFGLMFGDVGHGLVLAAAGWLALSGKVAALKGARGLAPILVAAGASAMVFGFLYGSIFGIEDVLPALWLRPLDDIMSILLATVVLGVGISLVGFAANIANGLRARDWRRVLFDRYGLAGLWFYLGLLGVVFAVATGVALPSGLIPLALIPPLVLLTLGEPLGNLINKRRPLIHEGVGLYLITAFFELFEAFIGYLSNSLSYVRLGAFAVAHGGLMSVFFILAGMMGGPSSLLYWLVVLVGNIFVIGFEGLIVGIQTLRLEYYEFFSKFFTGGGLPYRPLELSDKQTS